MRQNGKPWSCRHRILILSVDEEDGANSFFMPPGTEQNRMGFIPRKEVKFIYICNHKFFYDKG